MGDTKSFWRRLFSRRPDESPAGGAGDRFARFERFEAPRSPASAAREARRCTGVFIRSAIEQRRFETAAFTLKASGKTADAERLGDEALRAGKYGQAIQIFTRIGHHEKTAVANDMAAQECLKRGAPRKITAGHLYAAIHGYSRLLTPQRNDRRAIMRKMVALSEALTEVLEKDGEHLGAADTCLYCAQLCLHLAAMGRNQEVYVEDPEFYEGVRRKAADHAGRAREGYRRHVEATNLSPDDPEGRKIVEKLKAVQKVLDLAADHHRGHP